jgi:alanine racemase
VVPFPARAVVDLAAIRQNVRLLAGHAGRAAVMAIVKADAYGHGLLPVARAALDGGATWLGTAQVSEALTLRAAGVTAPVLTWLYAPGAPLARAITAGIDVSVTAPWALAEVVSAVGATGRPARVHLEIDTGLGRSGVFAAQLPLLLRAAMRAQADGALDVVGVWSHLARADEVGHPSVRAQIAAFDDAVRACERAGANLEVRHLAASAAVLSEPRTQYDLVRPGIALYGLSPFPDRASAADLGLRPAMRLEAQLSIVKPAAEGQGVSYGHDYVTPRDTYLGVVPIGYADGVPRHASNAGPVRIMGRNLRVAGRVCMDQFVLDLGAGLPGGGVPARAGDTVVLFGSGDDGEPTAQDWAEAAGTISYEIVTRLGTRIPREYVDSERGGEQGAGAA